jgi:hypothetical protein
VKGSSSSSSSRNSSPCCSTAPNALHCGCMPQQLVAKRFNKFVSSLCNTVQATSSPCTNLRNLSRRIYPVMQHKLNSSVLCLRCPCLQEAPPQACRDLQLHPARQPEPRRLHGHQGEPATRLRAVHVSRQRHHTLGKRVDAQHSSL